VNKITKGNIAFILFGECFRGRCRGVAVSVVVSVAGDYGSYESM
jgi:hypothetical protein